MYLYILEYIKSYQSYSCITSPTHLQYATFCASSSRDSLVEDQCATVTSSHIWHMTQAYRDITNRKPTNAQRDATWHNVTQRDTTHPSQKTTSKIPPFPRGILQFLMANTQQTRPSSLRETANLSTQHHHTQMHCCSSPKEKCLVASASSQRFVCWRKTDCLGRSCN